MLSILERLICRCVGLLGSMLARFLFTLAYTVGSVVMCCSYYELQIN